MNSCWPLQDQVFWYVHGDAVKTCTTDQRAQVAIIGGGMAGLSAAKAWNKRGKQVVVLEQYYCGSGASGKSSGFVTPNAELSFTDFAKRYDMQAARTIWDCITRGVADIRTTIEQNKMNCDFMPQDTLMLANDQKSLNILETEYRNLSDHGYPTEFYIDNLQSYIGSSQYCGALRYNGTFSINGYAYCQEMKKHLVAEGVSVFEETPVLAINGHTITTPYATITADYIIICCDRFVPQLGLLTQQVYHAQTFVMLSSPLPAEQVSSLFPNRPFMAWDSELIYNYFRLTHDNRFLLGGGDFVSTYAAQEKHNYSSIVTKLTNYLKKMFPQLSVQFEYVWPGLIGLSKDIAPLAGSDKHSPHIYYVTACAGLPIAAALGRYSAEQLIDGNKSLDAYFSPYRKFPLGGITQKILGTKLSFALSNLLKRNIP